MITDDPDTPGPGRWELNIPVIAEFSSAEKVISFPYIDANYGWGERIQLKFETGWVYSSFQDEGSHRGFGTGLAGVKWRFLDQDEYGVSMSIYPQIEFHHFFTSDDSSVADPGTRLFFPVEISRNLGFIGLNAEFGYNHFTSISHEWAYGLILGHEFDELHEVMLETHGLARADGSGTELILNGGTTFGVNKVLRVIGSLGHTIATQTDELSHFVAYLGAQVKL
jgi:hypothetical protein